MIISRIFYRSYSIMLLIYMICWYNDEAAFVFRHDFVVMFLNTSSSLKYTALMTLHKCDSPFTQSYSCTNTDSFTDIFYVYKLANTVFFGERLKRMNKFWVN